MRFAKRKRRKSRHETTAKIYRKQILWNNPSIVEELFSDSQWINQTQSDIKKVPSKKMEEEIVKKLSEIQAEDRKKLSRNNTIHLLLSYSSVACLVLFILIGVNQYHNLDNQKQKIAVIDHAREKHWHETSNTQDTTQTLYLPDSSMVVLYPNTCIKYIVSNYNNAREIHLFGKALFSVKKDKTRPFSVYAGGTKTTALGTSFTVDTQQENTLTSVELHSGKVVIVSTAPTAGFTNVYLTQKGDRLTFDRNTNQVQQKTKARKTRTSKPQRKLTSFQDAHPKRGTIQIDNQPIIEVLVELEKAYQTRIQILDNTIAKIQYTGIIDTERESLTDVLAVICLINDLEYTINDQSGYTLTRKNIKK